MLQHLQLSAVIAIAFRSIPCVQPESIFRNVVPEVKYFALEAVEEKNAALFRIVWTTVVFVPQVWQEIVQLTDRLCCVSIIPIGPSPLKRRCWSTRLPIHQRMMRWILCKQIEKKSSPRPWRSKDEQRPTDRGFQSLWMPVAVGLQQ